jgi:hypothetical protein
MTRPYVSRLQIHTGALAALAVALAPLAYFYPATAGRLVISPDDGVIFNIPLREAAARILLSGSLPPCSSRSTGSTSPSRRPPRRT